MRAKASTTSAPVNSKTYKDVGRETVAASANNIELEKKIEWANERVRNTIDLAFEKAVAHREKPSEFPLPSGRSVERAFHELLSAMPALRRKKAIDRVNETLKATAGARSAKYKDIVDVDLRSAVSVTEQVRSIPVPDTIKFKQEEADELLSRYRLKTVKPSKAVPAASAKSKAVPRQAVSATNLSFVVDSMTCLNPDDLIKDEISLAGFSIDTTGTKATLAALFVGKFKKNDTVSLGGNSKLFTLPIDPILTPQTFTAGLFLIESDWVSNEEALDKLFNVCFAVSQAVAVGFIPIVILTGTLAPTLIAPVCIVLGGIVLASMAGKILAFTIGDDISNSITDTLVVEDKVEIGQEFARSLTIGEGRNAGSFDGQYTLTGRWVGEA